MKSLKHLALIIVALASLILTWPYAFAWIAGGGNIFNAYDFFADAIRPGGTGAFLSVDILIVWVVYVVWVVTDAQRIGAGMKWGGLFAILSYLGVCFSFPLYIVFRERHLDRLAAQG
ncbi:DUF2834 domain-containing protein [Hyphomonas sp.]|uniref:DUF2834 domain-containing protein n=1 Tax=Hyphomonas sp. TaxID=87 RepID=UPI003F6EB820